MVIFKLKIENKKPLNLINGFCWWRGVDSNHRSLGRQIYSLLPLATREPLQKKWSW